MFIIPIYSELFSECNTKQFVRIISSEQDFSHIYIVLISSSKGGLKCVPQKSYKNFIEIVLQTFFKFLKLERKCIFLNFA